jgi:hypothetical protein
MQQRQLRLGDTLDDYCPRERRLANHTIVAMVGDDIRLTRCTTCDTEHVYKGGKAPRLRKKPTSVEAAYNEVLESVKQDTRTPAAAPASTTSVAAIDDTVGDGSASDSERIEAGDAEPGSSNGSGAPMPPEEVRLHRPLIRAQLPRIEREPLPRAIPEFTIRQAGKRQGRFQNSRPPGRFAKTGGAGGGNNRPGNSRGPGGPQHGMRPGGRPPGHGGRPPQHSGKKRSR